MDTASTFRTGQRVTDHEGNRATFIRMGDKRNGFNWRDNIALVRYVGDPHASAVSANNLVAGWRR